MDIRRFVLLSFFGSLICFKNPLKAAPLQVIPAVQSWEQGEKTFTVRNPVIVSNGHETLAHFLASHTEGGRVVNTGQGAISLQIKPSKELSTSKESYQITISEEGIEVAAPAETGLFYGIQTLRQLLVHSPILSCGVIQDTPRYPVRSLLLDVGRKFISVEGLKDWIRVMAWFKMNELHLHLNDNSWGRYPGYRLESKAFPGLASKDGHYTFEQIKELQQFAKLRGVTIVPEIDTPGHALAFTTYRPDLANRHIDRPGFGLAYLDLHNPDVYRFMEQIWDEVAPLFDSKVVHIGTDEYRINLIKDQALRKETGEKFRQYINHFNQYLRTKHSKTVRMWSGYEHLPGVTEPDRNIIIDMWVSSDVKKKSEQGYQFVNSSDSFTYIVPGAPYYGVNNRVIYQSWNPHYFLWDKRVHPHLPHEEKGRLPEGGKGLLGGKLHIWNDFGPTGFTWNEIARLALPSMAAMSEKLWSAQNVTTYEEFLRYATPLQEALFPLNLFHRNKPIKPESKVVWKLEKEKTFIANSQHALALEKENLEYTWTATFTLTRHNDIIGNEVLASSDLAEVYLDYAEDFSYKRGKQEHHFKKKGVAIVRACQAPNDRPSLSYRPQVVLFDYEVPIGEKVTLTFIGERRKTDLYVNGKKVKSHHLDKNPGAIHVAQGTVQTVFPLKQLGHRLPESMNATLHDAEILLEAIPPSPQE